MDVRVFQCTELNTEHRSLIVETKFKAPNKRKRELHIRVLREEEKRVQNPRKIQEWLRTKEKKNRGGRNSGC
jgi:hypothetical protein